jgi:hypothetical protein
MKILIEIIISSYVWVDLKIKNETVVDIFYDKLKKYIIYTRKW